MWFTHGDSVLQHAQLVYFLFIVCISVGAFQEGAKRYIVLSDWGESPFATAHVFRAVPCRVTGCNHVFKKPFKDNSNLVPRGHYHGAPVEQDWKLCLFVLAQSEELKGTLALSCCRKLNRGHPTTIFGGYLSSELIRCADQTDGIH